MEQEHLEVLYRIEGKVDGVVDRVAMLEKVLTIGNGQPSVLTRLSKTEERLLSVDNGCQSCGWYGVNKKLVYGFILGVLLLLATNLQTLLPYLH